MYMIIEFQQKYGKQDTDIDNATEQPSSTKSHQ